MPIVSKYIIQCDKRDMGGELTILRTHETRDAVNQDWNEFTEHDDWRIQYWLVGVSIMRNGKEQHNVIDFKGRTL